MPYEWRIRRRGNSADYEQGAAEFTDTRSRPSRTTLHFGELDIASDPHFDSPTFHPLNEIRRSRGKRESSSGEGGYVVDRWTC